MKPNVIQFAMLSGLVFLFLTSVVSGHEFETGHIERSIDVVVRNQNVQVKYSLGLADETIVDWLAREGLLAKEDESRFRKCIAELEAKSLPTKADSTVPKQPEQNSQSAEVEPLAFQSELIQLLRDKLSDAVCGNIHLSLDGQKTEFEKSTVANSARHHVALEIVLTVKLNVPSTTELSLVDRNFLDMVELLEEAAPVDAANEQPSKTKTVNSESATDSSAKIAKKHRYFGNVRLACRVKGNAIQLNSNVAPVLARSKPVDVGPMTVEERTEAATIRTKIGFAQPKAR